MRRKVIKQGKNTLTLTLPSKWAIRNTIRAGDELDVTERGRELLVSSVEHQTARTISIDISSLRTRAIWRMISSVYRAGYDEIRVKFDSNGSGHVHTAFTLDTLSRRIPNEDALSPIEAVQALVNRLVGMVIIEQRGSYCVIRELGETSPKEFDNAFRRIFHLLTTMAEILEGAFKGNFDELKEIHILDTNLDRFEDLCLRLLNKYGHEDYRKTQTMYSLIFTLELLGDSFKKIGLLLMEGERASKNVETMFHHVVGMFKAYSVLQYHFSTAQAQKIYHLTEEMNRVYAKLKSEANKKDVELIIYTKRVALFVNSLTELRIDLEYM